MTTDIQMLFDRDPLELSKQDLDEIIAYFRAHRHAFNTTGKAPPKKKQSEKLLDLDIEL